MKTHFCQTLVTAGLLLLSPALAHSQGAGSQAPSPVSAAFVHPGLLHSRQELEFIRQKVAAEDDPWKTAWEKLRTSESASLDYKSRPRSEVVRGPYNNPNIGSSEFSNDSGAAEMAWKQGVDLYGASSNRLALGFEYTAKYNLGHDVPYEPYRSFEGTYFNPAISSKSRGRFAPIYDRIVYHYHGRKGLEMPYSRQAVAKSGGGGRSGGAHVPWGALMFAELPQAKSESK